MNLVSLIPLSIRRTLGGRWDRWTAARQKRQLLRSLEGDAVACNVCRWEGSRFTGDLWHPGTVCPQCLSQVRHRMLVAILDGRTLVNAPTETGLLAGKEVLHFAPERQLRERIRSIAAHHVTADFDRGDCDMRLDLSCMPEVSEASFDTLIACDVLEHVLDDTAAFQEIFRVLKPGGLAILTVPQRDAPATTDEDPIVTSEPERERRFGQKDHVRMYGDDFAERVSAAGLTVQTIDQSAFAPETVARHVLHPPQLSSNPLATNQRRIYFATKNP